MKHSISTLLSVALLAALPAQAQTMNVTRAASRSATAAPSDNFTGSARVEGLFAPLEPAHAGGGSVTFEPGARTAWHSHPRGQVLIVTEGEGRAQQWGEPVDELYAGDVVQIPAGQKHWHGASPRSSMTHIAISEHRDGATVEWMEKVSDAQYNGPVRPPQSIAQQSNSSAAAGQTPSPNPPPAAARPSGPVQQRVAPGLAALTDDVLYGDIWPRPELSPRDRSLVTISVMIATGKTAQLGGHLGRALDNGLTPREASGVLAHLAVYSGWPSAVSALEVYDQVYSARKVDTASLGAAIPRGGAPAADARSDAPIPGSLSAIAPKFAQLTNDVVFGDLWRRTDLTPRDRSLVTIAALAAMGDDDQLEPYLRRGVESGLTRADIAEALTHLGFYAGWPKAAKAMSALAGMPAAN